MRILVTRGAGHLGEALVRSLPPAGHEIVGLDDLDSAFTARVGSITNPEFVARCMDGVDAVVHTATLHKPLMLLSASLILTSTTSVAGGFSAGCYATTTASQPDAAIPPGTHCKYVKPSPQRCFAHFAQAGREMLLTADT